MTDNYMDDDNLLFLIAEISSGERIVGACFDCAKAVESCGSLTAKAGVFETYVVFPRAFSFGVTQ